MINKPDFNYIQISNSSFQSDKLHELNENSFILFNSDVKESEHIFAFERIKQLNLKFNKYDCNNLYVWAGSKRFNYKYCKLFITNKTIN